MKAKIFSSGSIMLFFTAFIWGIAFVAQSSAMDAVSPFTFNCIRSFLGGAVLIPCAFIIDRLGGVKRSAFLTKNELVGGVACGVVLAVASMLQQYGIAMGASAGKAAFITSLYVIFVPIMALFAGKRTSPFVLFGAFMALVGVALISVKAEQSLYVELSDLVLLGCAILFALHIIVIDFASPKGDGVRISMVQFFVCFILTAPFMLFLERPELSDIVNASGPIAYAGIFSCGVAYTLQIIGQKKCDPTAATIILSLESVFGALGGALLLGIIGGDKNELMTPRQIVGCAIVFSAVLITQLKISKTERKAENTKESKKCE